MPTVQPRPKGRILLTAKWVVGHSRGRHHLIEHGEVVFEDGTIVFVGRGFDGDVARREDYGLALIGPGFVDLDALSDLDTTILAFDNQPAWKKGRVWPRSYINAGPYEMYSREELARGERPSRSSATLRRPQHSLAFGPISDQVSGQAIRSSKRMDRLRHITMRNAD